MTELQKYIMTFGTTRGVYNCLCLVQIVVVPCLQCHLFAAFLYCVIFNLWTHRMRREGNLGDITSMLYAKCHKNGCFVEVKGEVAWVDL